MPAISVTNSFTDGTTASAEEVNTNFTDLVTGVNNLDGDNVNASIANGIVIKNAATTISAIFTFSANPVFNALAIVDAALSANVPLKDGANEFSASNTFTEAIEGLKVPILGAHPADTAANNNKIYELSSDGNIYVYKTGTGAIQLDYTDAYTGGAPNTYNGQIVIDENSPAYLMIKAETGFSTASLSLIGMGFPSYIYTEIGSHTHAYGTLALASGAVSGLTHTHDTDIGHTHSGTFGRSDHIHTETGSHSHLVDINSQYFDIDDHRHSSGYVTTGSSDIPNAVLGSSSMTHTHSVTGYSSYASPAGANHRHGVYGNTNGNTDLTTVGAPSQTASVGSYVGSLTSENNSAVTATVGTTMSGSTAAYGISGNTLNTVIKLAITTAITIYITTDISAGWGTALDSGDLAGLLNINTDNGTGAMDISSYISEGMNYIKIVDPTANKGCSLLYHCQTV